MPLLSSSTTSDNNSSSYVESEHVSKDGSRFVVNKPKVEQLLKRYKMQAMVESHPDFAARRKWTAEERAANELRCQTVNGHVGRVTELLSSF